MQAETPHPMKALADLSDDEFTHLARRAVAAPDAPAAWRQAAQQAWQQAHGASTTAPLPGFGTLAVQAVQAVGRRLAASLSFDSWATAPLATGRRTLRGETRQFIFNAEGRDIDLRVTAVADGFALAGQVLGPDEAGAVTLAPVAAPATTTRSASLDPLGEFHLPDVAAGQYLLTLRLGDTEIELPPIDVGMPSA